MEMIDQREMLHQDHDQLEGSSRMKLEPQTPRSPYAWLKSTAHDLEFKCKNRCFIGKRGKNRKRHCSEDFRYDPESYSLNFEDDVHREYELPLKSRLPATPERLVMVAPPPVRRTELQMWS
ncbi:hypothetical protein POTOM_013452 [Populus tomentosa]|uniref:Uncharacterized protein n=1 Tax=Populus tomentosa TaxID=118781 RepID=A0A8X8A2M5_POPTO|nr:hypothetical protein POTOM_013452 [Populus tomentosa]